MSIFKTRFFVTNSLNFLPECDRVIILNKGTISDIGTYKELIAKPEFSEFVGQYFQNTNEEKEK